MIRALNNPLESISPMNFAPTPTLVGGSGNTVPQYTTNSGRYSRVGKRVNCEIYLDGDGGNEGAGTGSMNLALPIQAGPNHPTGAICVGVYRNSSGTPVYGILFGTIVPSSTTISLQKIAGGNLVAFNGSDQAGTTRFLRLSFSYEIA